MVPILGFGYRSETLARCVVVVLTLRVNRMGYLLAPALCGNFACEVFCEGRLLGVLRSSRSRDKRRSECDTLKGQSEGGFCWMMEAPPAKFRAVSFMWPPEQKGGPRIWL